MIAEQIEARQGISLVQDWHPSAPQFSSAKVLPHVVTEKGDPTELRTLPVSRPPREPLRRKKLRAIRLRSLKPEARATLALLGITVEN